MMNLKIPIFFPSLRLATPKLTFLLFYPSNKRSLSMYSKPSFINVKHWIFSFSAIQISTNLKLCTAQEQSTELSKTSWDYENGKLLTFVVNHDLPYFLCLLKFEGNWDWKLVSGLSHQKILTKIWFELQWKFSMVCPMTSKIPYTCKPTIFQFI